MESVEKEELLVTIQCITYNQELYIRQCLEGFVLQKTHFRFEAIVHDDASTDKTAEIIREFADKYPDIIKPIYETENQYSKRDGSLARIMNEHTFGKYVAACEGDDYWIDPLKLQKQVDFLESNPDYGLCVTNVKSFNQSTKKLSGCFFTTEIESKIDSLQHYIVEHPWIATCTWMYRQSIYNEYADFIDNRTFCVGDLPVVLFFLYKSKVTYIDSVTAVYRVLSSSASHFSNAEKMYRYVKGILEIILFFYEKCGLDNGVKEEIMENYYICHKNILPLYSEPEEVSRVWKTLVKRKQISFRDRVTFTIIKSNLLKKIVIYLYNFVLKIRPI